MTQLIQELEKTEQKILNILSQAEQRIFKLKPSEGAWSIAEIMEHLVKVETAILKNLHQKILEGKEGVVENTKGNEAIRSLSSNRQLKIKSPDMFLPQDGHTSKVEAIAAFTKTRSAIKNLLNTSSLKLKNIGFKHFKLGMLNGENWVAFIAGHSLRHAEQMEEIQKNN